MKPEQLLDPDTLPDDLRWLGAEFKLSPKDPVFLLIAWHWHRVKEAEDSLRAATVEFQAALDGRVKAVTAAAEKIASLRETLASLDTVLREKRTFVTTQLEDEVKRSVGQLHVAQRCMDTTVSAARDIIAKTRSREVLAALLTGVVIGVLGAFLGLS